MSAKRREARRARRGLRSWRRELVHAAGCAIDTCATVMAYRSDDAEALTRHVPPGVRIPRSLRRFAAETDA